MPHLTRIFHELLPRADIGFNLEGPAGAKLEQIERGAYVVLWMHEVNI